MTGASGFLGSHIVSQLLTSGYRVRASARAGKVSALKKAYSNYGDRFEAVVVKDIVTDQFPDALRGIHSVIHTASPLFGKAEPEEMLHVRCPLAFILS